MIDSTVTLAIRVPLTASITPGENCSVTPGSNVSVARAPIIRSSRMTHGLLRVSILKDCRKKPPFDIRLHAVCAPLLVGMATRANDTAMAVHSQSMLVSTTLYEVKCSVKHHRYKSRSEAQLSLVYFLERNVPFSITALRSATKIAKICKMQHQTVLSQNNKVGEAVRE